MTQSTFTTVASYRQWRQAARDARKTVGYVATMGALHDGHLSLVRRSLRENDLTVLSIFVNPAQFAPHEDLKTYPKTLENDLKLLSAQSFQDRTVSAVFAPTVKEMYPSGITQDPAAQKGTFVEVKGFSYEMEGKSRPTFFRGVSTVVTKLFNVIEPTQTYFGQKDIQQALLLRRMCRDLLLSHPVPENLHIVPTRRDNTDGLALSSRNTYLSAEARLVAPKLYEALQAGEAAWNEGLTKAQSVAKAVKVIQDTAGVRLDYIEMNDPETFEALEDESRARGDAVILSGAAWVNTTRLIDNIILGNANTIWG
ncbi:Pantoate-beta-alanine ligase [Guyanagaster necrorhizus]|uniref:Pantoate--beta-alanine ligase n=1 Tax=Guyanagaster necrorhizus TaxID=856835 RepID=A0A9P7VQG9_9AGAR|nr:Pantoate-beta-alanine ligase [Guyanagaster necrorhizus MCA 3950]KAG7445029.1 Pantoate-beta-alanine ligase [Guyanagaster necrorhizus MCA 3950]